MAILTELMQLDPEESAKFWPEYNEYDKALTKLGDERIAFIRMWAEVDATGTSKKKAVRRGVGLGAVGAGIGAIAGGGSGAAIGAAIGGGVGAVSAAGAKGKQLNVPSETRLLFALKAPVPMN